MFTNNQSLIITGILAIGFFFAGLFNILDHFIVKLTLSALVILIILNLFLVKKDDLNETDDATSSDSEV